MGKRFFTVDEVNELIPQLEHHFRQMLVHKREMSKVAARLRRMGIEPQLLEVPVTATTTEGDKLHQQLHEHYSSFKQQLLSIEGMGGEIKDLELGRVDFPSLDQGREGRLTWQLGVTEVAYEHPFPEDTSGHPVENQKIRKVS